LGTCQDKRDGTEVGIHGGAGGAVSRDDDGLGELDLETGEDDGVGWIRQVICICPYVPLGLVPLGFGLGSEDSEDVPIALEDVFVEEANAAIADAHGIGGPVINVFPVEEIVLEFLLGDQIGGFAVELAEHANGAGVGLLSPFSFTIELKGLDRSVIPLCLHDTSPFSIMRDSPFQ
jgi:hypothetical protein